MVLTCDTSNVVHAPGHYDTPNGYYIGGQNFISLASSRAQLNFSGSWTVTTDSSARLQFGYSGGNNLLLNNDGTAAFGGALTVGNLMVGAHQVVGAQQGAIANFTAAGGWADTPSYTDFSNLVTKLNDILTAIRNHGLIAT